MRFAPYGVLNCVNRQTISNWFQRSHDGMAFIFLDTISQIEVAIENNKLGITFPSKLHRRDLILSHNEIWLSINYLL